MTVWIWVGTYLVLITALLWFMYRSGRHRH
jgi:hypothetical protein